METNLKEIEINGVVYVPKSQQQAVNPEGLEYVICRTLEAGVFAGYLQSRNGSEATLINARRLWKWSGAASLSQLSMEGVKDPAGSKFPCEVLKVLLLGVIEVLQCSEAARINISEVPVWKV